MTDLAAKVLFGATTPTGPSPASRPTTLLDGALPPAVARGSFYDGRSSNEQRQANTGPKFVFDGGSLRNPETGARAPLPQGDESFEGRNARMGAELYGPTNTTDGEAISPLESLGVAADPDTLETYKEAGLNAFGGPCDTAENRLLVSKAIDAATPNIPTLAKAELAGDYVRFGSLTGVEPAAVGAIASEAQRVFADGGTVTTEMVEKWNFTNKNLAAEYGSRAPQVVAEARRLVRQDPRGFKALMRTGMIGSPTVTRALLQAADRKLRNAR